MRKDSDNEYLFTSESVTEGHPDKVADQISDGVLDAVLADDPYGRVACETLVNTGLIVVSGEISTDTYVDIQEIARETVRKIGYDNATYGFDCDTCAVINAIDKQSPDIAQGVDAAYETRHDPADEGELVPYLRPDGKTQVTVRYQDGRPVEIEKILISTQHADGIDAESLIKPDLLEHVLRPVLPAELYDEKKLLRNFLVNPTGRFVIGGPMGDCGLTGRKIIVDSCLADRAEVQVAYAICVSHPVSVMIDTFATEKEDRTRAQIARAVDEVFDLRPGAFREELKLHRPIYQKTAAYGHFGRDDHDFTWERTDKAQALRTAAGL